LFSENAGVYLVSIDPKDQAEFEKSLADVDFAEIGKVSGLDCLDIHDQDGFNIISLDRVKESYQAPLRLAS